MKTFLKILLYIFILALLVAAISLLVIYETWPWWIGAAIFFIAIALFLIFVYIRKYFFRRKEKQFVQRVIAQEGERLYSKNEEEILRNRLEEKWYASIDKLKHSLLRKKGNPIYALPWFMTLGPKDSGKSTFIDSTNLASSLTDIDYAHATDNCNWWYLDQAIILDTSGKYVEPTNDVKVNKEWEHLLVLLAKFRKKEPLNGVIVTISSDQLFQKDKESLIDEGIFIRKRIDQLMNVVGANFPVYIMVTKMDHVYGYNDLCNALPNRFNEQVFGYTNSLAFKYINIEWKKVIDEAIVYINQVIAQLTLLIVSKESIKHKGITQFGKEMLTITSQLQIYLEAIFKENLYQEIPMFRGVYFSNSLRDDVTNSKFFEKYLVDDENTKKVKNPHFLNDFFEKILPYDRNHFSFLHDFISWRKSLKNLWVSIAVILVFAVGALVTYSYTQNSTVLQMVKQYKTPPLTHNFAANIQIMYEDYLYILNVQKEVNRFLLPGILFDYGAQAKQAIITQFVEDFKSHLLASYDTYFASLVSSEGRAIDSNDFGDYMGYLLTSISLNKTMINQGFQKIDESNAHFIRQILLTNDSINSEQIIQKYTTLLQVFYQWNSNWQLTQERNTVMEEQLIKLLQWKGDNLEWLASEAVTETSDITLAEFWPDLSQEYINNSPKVLGAYTESGRKKIQKYIDIIYSVIGTEVRQFNYFVAQFWNWYNQMFFYDWKNFIKNFADPMNHYNYGINKPMLIYFVTSRENPFIKMVDIASTELKSYQSNSSPSWSKEIIYLDSLNILSNNINDTNTTGAKNTSFISQIRDKEKQFFRELQSGVAEEYAQKVNDASHLNNYYTALSQLGTVDTDINQIVSKFFAPSNKSSNLEKAYQNLIKFKYDVTNQIQHDFVFNLVSGPYYFVINYAINREACLLNEAWNNEVLSPSTHVDKVRLIPTLFDSKNGTVSKFISTYASNYLSPISGVYKSRHVEEYSIPFVKNYLNFLTHGYKLIQSYQQEYKVTLSPTPIEINYKSFIEPFAVVLNVNCTKKNQTLVNLNYREKETFTWSPEDCGDTTVRIRFEEFELIKVYPGPFGFAEFLSDYKDGNQVYTVKDFPDYAKEFKRNNISWIKVNYDITGDIFKAIELLDPVPYNVPKTIAICGKQ